MALKDWRQTSTSPRWKRWRNRHKDEVVHIVLDKDNTWYFMVKDNQRAFILKENLTKERALKFAKAYMKKH